jgi:hypothetical protein
MKKILFGAGVLITAVLMLLPSMTAVNHRLSKFSPAGKTLTADGSPLPPPIPPPLKAIAFA